MTVQELIDALFEVKDKSKKVVYNTGFGCFEFIKDIEENSNSIVLL